MKALIIVDMLNDFVDGQLANPRAQDRKLVGDLQFIAPEAEHRRRAASTSSRRASLAGRLQEAAAQQDALEIRSGDVVPERGLVDRPKLRDREGRGSEGKAEVRVGELGAEPLAAREHDLTVVEGELRQVTDGMPVRVAGYSRIDVRRHEAEVRGPENPRARMAIGLAERHQLLQVGKLAHVDLRREVAPDRLLEGLPIVEVSTRQGPGSEERLPRPLPEQDLKLAPPHLEYDGECLMAGRDRSGRLLH